MHVHQHLQAILLIIKSAAQRRNSFSGSTASRLQASGIRDLRQTVSEEDANGKFVFPPNSFLNSDVSAQKAQFVHCEAVAEPEQCDELCYVDADAERTAQYGTPSHRFPFSCVC